MLESLTKLADDPVLLFVGIILATFILEDGATVAAALLAVDDRIAPLMALLALLTGIFAGDLGLYWIGRIAAFSRRIRRFIGIGRLRSGRRWLNKRMILTLFGARFTPGMRTPTFLTMGFLGVRFWRFALIAMVAVSIWATLVFSVVLVFGEAVAEILGGWIWLVGVVLILLLLIRSVMASRRTQESEPVQIP